MRELCTQEMRQPKKPSNAFFLYRKAMKEYITTTFNLTKSHEIVKQAAIMWKNESEDVKEKYKQMSNEEFKEHKRLYPDYVWPSGANSIKRVQKRRVSSPAPPVLTPATSPPSTPGQLSQQFTHRKSLSAGNGMGQFSHRNSIAGYSPGMPYSTLHRNSSPLPIHRSSISFSGPPRHKRTFSGSSLNVFQPEPIPMPMVFPSQEMFFQPQVVHSSPVSEQIDLSTQKLDNLYEFPQHPWSF